MSLYSMSIADDNGMDFRATDGRVPAALSKSTVHAVLSERTFSVIKGGEVDNDNRDGHDDSEHGDEDETGWETERSSQSLFPQPKKRRTGRHLETRVVQGPAPVAAVVASPMSVDSGMGLRAPAAGSKRKVSAAPMIDVR